MNLKALYKLSYGLYVVSSKKGNRLNGQVANSVFQVTSEPPTIAVSINKNNLTHEFIIVMKWMKPRHPCLLVTPSLTWKRG